MKLFARCLLILAFGVTIAVASCNSGGTTVSVAKEKKMLPGKWKLVKITTDPADTATGASDDNNIVVTFREDGTGSSSSSGGSGGSFTYTFGDNDNYLRITDSGASQPTALLITKISGSSFTAKDTSAHPAQWETYKKQ